MIERARRRPLLVAVAAVAAAATLVAGWLAWTSRPLGNPSATEWADAALSDRLTSATVLALGEATHGTAEFKTARLQLLQKVVGRGFTTVAFEEDFGSMVAVDAWLQGGAGSADDAVRRFGYRLNRTVEVRDLLLWVRAYNEGRPADQRIRFVGVDAARPDALKAVALGWLATRDAAASAVLTERLAPLTDATMFDKRVADETRAAVADLQTALGASDDGSLGAQQAIQAGRVLDQARQRAHESGLRDHLLFDNLRWVVETSAARGRTHTLLFSHNGHVDKSGQSMVAPGTTLGQLAFRHFGDAYRTIGTDGRRVSLASGGEVFTLSVDAPYRGLFAGTTVGYLETSSVTGANAEVLRSRGPQVSAGEPFAAWAAWVPLLHTAPVVPIEAWDAVIYCQTAGAAIPLV